jgi:hypothetical protein
MLAILGIFVTGSFFAAETKEHLEQQLAQIHERTSAAGKFVQLAQYVINNESKASESNDSLTQQFEEMRKNQGESSLIVFRAIATKEEAQASRAYYLGVRNNLFAAEVVLTFEIMASQASSNEISSSVRESLDNGFAQTFDGMKEMITGSHLPILSAERLSVATIDAAISACTYYAGVKNNLLGRTEAMAKEESFG